jgi:hypothetical protein
MSAGNFRFFSVQVIADNDSLGWNNVIVNTEFSVSCLCFYKTGRESYTFLF